MWNQNLWADIYLSENKYLNRCEIGEVIRVAVRLHDASILISRTYICVYVERQVKLTFTLRASIYADWGEWMQSEKQQRDMLSSGPTKTKLQLNNYWIFQIVPKPILTQCSVQMWWMILWQSFCEDEKSSSCYTWWGCGEDQIPFLTRQILHYVNRRFKKRYPGRKKKYLIFKENLS